MSQSIQVFFRPTEIKFVESLRTETDVTYNVTTMVHFFSDEAMMNQLYSKEFTFTDVPFKPDWMGTLGDIYALISNKI